MGRNVHNQPATTPANQSSKLKDLFSEKSDSKIDVVTSNHLQLWKSVSYLAARLGCTDCPNSLSSGFSLDDITGFTKKIKCCEKSDLILAIEHYCSKEIEENISLPGIKFSWEVLKSVKGLQCFVGEPQEN